MNHALHGIGLFFVCVSAWFSQAAAHDKKLEKVRIGGGAAAPTR